MVVEVRCPEFLKAIRLVGPRVRVPADMDDAVAALIQYLYTDSVDHGTVSALI